MTSLPEQLQSLVTSSPLFEDIGGQLGSLSSAASTLSNLIDSPPGEMGDLISGLSNISVTNIQLPDDFSSGFSNISDLLPTDLTDITGGLDTVLSGMSEVLDLDALNSIQQFIDCLGKVSQLIEMDFSKFGVAVGAVPSIAALSGRPDFSSRGDDSVEAGPNLAAAASERPALVAANNVSELLGSFPTPFTAKNVVGFFCDLLKGLPRDNAKMSHIPVYDDLFELLNTAQVFSEMDLPGLESHIQNTLGALETALDREGLKPVHDLSQQVSDVLAQIDFIELESQITLAADAMEVIASALAAGDITGVDGQILAVNTALDMVLPQLETLRGDGLGNEIVLLNRSLSKLNSRLNFSMDRLESVLKPPGTADFFVLIENFIQEGINSSGINDLTQGVEKLFKQATDILGLLNASAVKETLGTVTTGLSASLDAFDTAVFQVTGRVSMVFDEVETALDVVDTADFRETIENTLQQIQTTIESVIDSLFTPLRTAITSAVDLLESAVDSFNPEQIKTALETVIDQITALFSSPEVMEGISLIKSTLEAVTKQIQAASFTPIVDGVVTGIDGVKEVFQSIPSSLLSDSIKQQIQTAVNALPRDLEQPINTLTSELDQLIEDGPKPLILQIQKPVESLAAQLNEISPDKLVGNELFKEYETLLKTLAGFTPSTLLTPIQTELAGLKTQISRQIDLAALLHPLEVLYDGMATQLNQLDPGSIIEPINQAMKEMTTGFLDILPDESVFEVLEKIVSGLEGARAFVGEIKSVVDKLTDMATELANPKTQLTQWMQPLLDQVDSLPEIPGIDLTLTRISQQIEGLKKTGIIAGINQAAAPLETALDSLAPQTLHNRVITVYARLNRSVIQALPPGPQKTDLLAILDRFNPVSPQVSQVFGRLHETRTKIQRSLAGAENMLNDWDDRYFGIDSSFMKLQLDNVSQQSVKEAMEQSIRDHIIEPIAKLFSSITVAFSSFDGPVNELSGFVDALDDLLADIIEGPGSLGEIQALLEGLVDRIDKLNLDFLEQELDEIFNGIKEKFNDINPKPLRESLQTLLDNTLDLMDVEQVLPQSEVDQIDNSYAGIIASLEALNPNTLISQIVQPAFDEKIGPLLKLFDLTDPIALLLERMEGLAQELDTELTKVDAAYQGMIQAVPV
jgi:hypothetical protein